MPKRYIPFNAIILVLCTFIYSSHAEEFAIIANKTFYKNSISQEDLRDIFLGKKKNFGVNEQIVISLFEDKKIHTQFVHKIIRKTPNQFKIWWKLQLYKGQGVLPVSFKTKEKLLEYISSTNGAIGYINSEFINDSVKRIEIK